MSILSENIADFSIEFHDEIRLLSHADEAMRENVFADKVGDILEDYGEIDSFISCYYKRQSTKINGYAYDYESDTLTLIVANYFDETDLQKVRIGSSDLERTYRYGLNFLERCIKEGYAWIDLSNEAVDLARLISENKSEINAVKLVLISDGIGPKNPAEIEQFEGMDLIRVIWDIERIYNYTKTGERQKVSIDFSEFESGPLETIDYSSVSNRYESYLAFIPGDVLADIYGKWGITVLDMNVRVFLSARGGVNKGIRRTIIEEPEMFCAYNNGITAYSENIKILENDGIRLLERAEDFQIINGGQTTASLYHARKRDRANLSKIKVPMKLIVISNREERLAYLNRISQYSNTQNKVQLADLAANESPHPEIQAISNSKMAPDPTGGSRQSYWFYERTRGSYEELRNLNARTPAQKRRFDLMRPKDQKFDKVKFGKVWNSYLKLPYVVSLGGQKNFARFNSWLREQKDEDWLSFFRKTVALLILWDRTEHIVRKKKFEGYRHNIVTYSLSLLFEKTNSRIDLESIWNRQKVSEATLESLDLITDLVNDHIRNTDMNITEYCKREECWRLLKEHDDIRLPIEIEEDFVEKGRSNGNYNPALSGEEETVDFCIEKGYKAWKELSKWLKERQFLSGKARSQCYIMGKTLESDKKRPSYSLSFACKKAWEEAETRGWKYDEPD